MMAATKPLAGKVCIVTGASRGIGKGVALQLGAAGATVYITGRTLKKNKESPVAGSLEETAAEVRERGGECIPVQCDHSKDEEVKQLFEKVAREQDDQLDVLVNNAFGAVKVISDAYKTPFWKLDPSIWDEINNVGLRNHYVCSVLGARLMVPRKQGLIVNISSSGGLFYTLNAVYGVGKEACDRMAVDCAVELKEHKVAFVSLWPGAVMTENVSYIIREKRYAEGDQAKVIEEFLENGESAEYTGLAVVHLAKDPNAMKKSGRAFFISDLASHYGFVDTDGTSRPCLRDLGYILTFLTGNRVYMKIIPSFIKIPRWVMYLMSSKF